MTTQRLLVPKSQSALTPAPTTLISMLSNKLVKPVKSVVPTLAQAVTTSPAGTTVQAISSVPVTLSSASKSVAKPESNAVATVAVSVLEPVSTPMPVLRSTRAPKPQPAPTVEESPTPTKRQDKALFYDYLIHGKLEIGETLILYRDGTFKKVGKSGR